METSDNIAGRTGSPTWSTSSTRVIESETAEVAAMIRDALAWPEWPPESTRSAVPREFDAGDVVQGDAEMLGVKVAGRADITGACRVAMEQDVIVGIRMKVRYEFTEVPGG